jgi:hypothetical protein
MYIISWTEENWYEVAIDADSEEEALQKFENKEYDPTTGMMIEKIKINSVRPSETWVV